MDYVSTFTPSGEEEKSKQCPKCENILPPTAFRKRVGTRDGIEGIIRNFKCRDCEGKLTDEKRKKKLFQEDERYSLMKEEFSKNAKILNSKLETCVGAIKRMDRELKRLSSENQLLKDRISSLEDDKISSLSF